MEYSIDEILSNGNTDRDVDGLLTFAYGKSIVQGPGSDDNLAADDTFWFEAWKDLITLPSSLYKVPDSSVGKRLTQILTTELENVRELRKFLKTYSFYTRSFTQSKRYHFILRHS